MKTTITILFALIGALTTGTYAQTPGKLTLFSGLAMEAEGNGTGIKFSPELGLKKGRFSFSSGLQFQKEDLHLAGAQLNLRKSLKMEDATGIDLFLFSASNWGFNNILVSSYREIIERVYEIEVSPEMMHYRTISQYFGFGAGSESAKKFNMYAMIGVGGYHSYKYIRKDVLPESFRATFDSSDISFFFKAGITMKNTRKKKDPAVLVNGMKPAGSGKF